MSTKSSQPHLKGASYRLRNRGIDTLPSIRETADRDPR
jgi:hypothetical protein